MIEPLKDDIVRILLDGIKHDRLIGGGGGSGGAAGGESTRFQADAVIKGVINSFVQVEEYKKKGSLEVRESRHSMVSDHARSTLRRLSILI